MSNWSNRLNVVLSILALQNKNCPYCDSNKTVFYGRNSPLSHIRHCINCGLIYRWPKQNKSFNSKFYQTLYSKVHQSAATDLPSSEQIARYRACNFKNSPRDFSHYTSLFEQLNVKSVLDYGCSWGYGVYQFSHSGLDAVGLEISQPRANFGRSNLGVTIYDNEHDIVSSGRQFDLIFSSHVLEHLPSPRVALNFFEKVTHQASYLVLEVPNCGGKSAADLGSKWGPFNSAIHPLSYTLDFFLTNLPHYNFKVLASPDKSLLSTHTRVNMSFSDITSSSEDDLVVIARKNSLN